MYPHGLLGHSCFAEGLRFHIYPWEPAKEGEHLGFPVIRLHFTQRYTNFLKKQDVQLHYLYWSSLRARGVQLQLYQKTQTNQQDETRRCLYCYVATSALGKKVRFEAAA